MAEFLAKGEIVYVEGRVVFSEDGLPFGVVGVNLPTDDEGTTLTIPEQFVAAEPTTALDRWIDEDDDLFPYDEDDDNFYSYGEGY